MNPSPKAPQIRAHYTFLKVLTGSDLSRRRLPLMHLTSNRPGPVVWLTACMHGDEVGGMVIVQEVFRRLRRELRRGQVYAFPLLNPTGFENVSRQISQSREDLNRSFPGSPEGSLGQRLASQVLGTILDTQPALVLDLHNDWIRSIPYVVVDGDPGADYATSWEESRALAAQTGFCVIEEVKPILGSLSLSLLQNRIPALTLEVGEAYVINEHNVEHGLNAILNILASMEMIAPAATPYVYPLPEAFRGRPMKYTDKPFASSSGIARFTVKPGDPVRAGQPIARVYNAFGKQIELIRAQHDGLTLGHTDSSVVFPGMPIMAFGIG